MKRRKKSLLMVKRKTVWKMEKMKFLKMKKKSVTIRTNPFLTTLVVKQQSVPKGWLN